MSYQNVFGETLSKHADLDDKIVAITAAMPDGTGVNIFNKKFPKRSFDVGIAEQHAVTFAAGLATEGFKPYAAIYSNFLAKSLRSWLCMMLQYKNYQSDLQLTGPV